jgi:hypothetical protein
MAFSCQLLTEVTPGALASQATLLDAALLDAMEIVRVHKKRRRNVTRRVAMKRNRSQQTDTDAFEIVKSVGLTLPGVEEATRYDGSPLLKVAGMFMAGLAMDPSVEAGTLVVRADLEERAAFLEDAPQTYYLTDHYRRYPVVLVRLSTVDRDALHDLLSMSRRLTLAKRRPSGSAAGEV